MKKILFLFLAVMILAASIASPLYADGGTVVSVAPQYENLLKSYTVYGADEAISTSTIGTHNKILGFQVSGNSAAAFIGIYDETTIVGSTATDLIAEASAASDTTTTIWFPFPRSITNGICVISDDATTSVTIFYI